MSSYIEQWCNAHGLWDMDVDNIAECPDCERLGLTEVQQLRARNAALVAALEDARLQIVYLHQKFGMTGSGNSVLAKIGAALEEAKGK